MSDKNDDKSKKSSPDKEEKELQKLMEEHPFETMSQVQNRYGDGRERPGSDGFGKDDERMNN